MNCLLKSDTRLISISYSVVSLDLFCPHTQSLDNVNIYYCTVKTLIRLSCCICWLRPLLFMYTSLHLVLQKSNQLALLNQPVWVFGEDHLVNFESKNVQCNHFAH